MYMHYVCQCIYLLDACRIGKMVFLIILILRYSSINFHSTSNRDRENTAAINFCPASNLNLVLQSL